MDFATGARTRIHDSFDAHRLLHWAGEEGRQLPLKRAMLRACFGRGADVADAGTLAGLAVQAGLPRERAAATLASDAFADAVYAEEQVFLRAGIRSVPAIILDRQYLGSSRQPVAVFDDVPQQMAARKRS